MRSTLNLGAKFLTQRWTRILACFLAIFVQTIGASAQPAPGKSPAVTVEVPAPPRPLLPDSFAGWVAAPAPTTVTDPAQADSANAAALKEYAFTHAAFATYKRDGETLSIHALSFIDTSGAYGAYTF